MTASQSCKSVRRACWLSTGHGGARPHVRNRPQIVRQFVELAAVRRSFLSRFAVAQPAASAQFKLAGSLAALKSP